MAEEATREALLQQTADQAAQIALLIAQNSEQAAQIKLLVEENARLKKRVEQLERQVKRYVAPHSREQPDLARVMWFLHPFGARGFGAQ